MFDGKKKIAYDHYLEMNKRCLYVHGFTIPLRYEIRTNRPTTAVVVMVAVSVIYCLHLVGTSLLSQRSI